MKEFGINNFLSVRLEKRETRLYICGQPFIICKFLLLNIPTTQIKNFDTIDSIDEAAELVDNVAEEEMREIEIPPEVEFWGHCSNLQVWYEQGYDTRLIHSNIAFQVLKKLTEVGDPLARDVYKGEIIKRYENGSEKTKEYLRKEGFLRDLPVDERLNLLLDNQNFGALMELSEEVTFDPNPLPTIESLLWRINIKEEKIIELDLSDLDLKTFPKAILKLKGLEILILNDNYLKTIPNEIRKLNSLKQLWIESNKITHLPDSICDMLTLEEIWAGGNKIQDLPDDIGDLINLRFLKLGSNEIRELPESFYRLVSLENLSLPDNQIKRLSDSFCNLKSLQWLSLSNNNLKKIPESLINIKSLNYININQNPLIKKNKKI